MVDGGSLTQCLVASCTGSAPKTRRQRYDAAQSRQCVQWRRYMYWRSCYMPRSTVVCGRRRCTDTHSLASLRVETSGSEPSKFRRGEPPAQPAGSTDAARGRCTSQVAPLLQRAPTFWEAHFPTPFANLNGHIVPPPTSWR